MRCDINFLRDVPKTTSQEARLVLNGLGDVPTVDVVEGISGIEPFFFYIVDYKFQVGWYECRLDCTKINAFYYGTRVFIGHFVSGQQLNNRRKRNTVLSMAQIPVPVPMKVIRLCLCPSGPNWILPT